MKGNNASTMRTREFLARLAEGHFDGGGIAAVVSTSYADDAAAARSVALDRSLANSVLVLEYDDVENPKRPTAFSDDMAADVVGFFERTVADEWVFVCDGAFSRSAAVMCAWARLYGGGDLDYWADPERYAPNVLVYRRILAAAGHELTDEQADRLSELKEAALERKVKKAGGVHNTGDLENRGAVKLAERQKQFVKALGELDSAGISELVGTTGVPTASAYNILKRLEGMGLVERAPGMKRMLTYRGILAYRKVSAGAAIAAPADDSGSRMDGMSVRGFEKEFFWLSNFFEAPVEIDGITYRNSEAAYQAGRCTDEAGKLKLAELDAASAKKYAHHEVDTRPDWEEFKIGHMRRVVAAKFEQHLDLAWELVRLDGELEELNWWHDNYWGNCECPECKDMPAQNMLGRVLMDVRRELRDGIARYWPRAQHSMRLAPGPFEMVAAGKKTIEMRLYDEKRRKVQVGDAITFTCTEGFRMPVGAVVKGVAVYPDFETMYRDIDLVAAGYEPGDVALASATDMERYYSVEDQREASAVAIYIELAEGGETLWIR